MWPFKTHRHVYKEVHRDFYLSKILFLGEGSPVTVITYKCTVPNCRKYKQQELTGWLRKED